jgi:hypothetical protein
MHCFHLEGQRFLPVALPDPENGGRMILQSIDKVLPDSRAPHPTKVLLKILIAIYSLKQLMRKL